MDRSNRRVFVCGLLSGLGVVSVVALAVGAGQLSAAGDTFVTSSADGRRAYLWTSNGSSLTFVASAEADKGHEGKKDEHGKPEDKHDDDHGKPDGKGKPDDANPGKGKKK